LPPLVSCTSSLSSSSSSSSSILLFRRPVFAHLLYKLPAVLRFELLTYLKPVDIAQLAVTSTLLREVTRDPLLWKLLYVHKWRITCNHDHDWGRLLKRRTAHFNRGRVFVCSHCSCTCAYASSDALFEHTFTHVVDKRTKSEAQYKFVCAWEGCKRRFNESTLLRRHMDDHKGKRANPCPQCSRSYHTPYALKLHMCKHTGKPRPHRCRFAGCSSSFNTPSALRKHALIHSTDRIRSFICKHCRKGFFDALALRLHIGRNLCGPKSKSTKD
jgi:hypothetical protein